MIYLCIGSSICLDRNLWTIKSARLTSAGGDMYSMEHFVINYLNFSEYWINVDIIYKQTENIKLSQQLQNIIEKLCTHIYDRSLSWPGTNTLINVSGLKLYGHNPTLLMKYKACKWVCSTSKYNDNTQK